MKIINLIVLKIKKFNSIGFWLSIYIRFASHDNNLKTDVLHRAPFAYVDLHGHSRRSNVFMYGNNPEESWLASDKQTKHDYEFLDIPEQLDQVCPHIDNELSVYFIRNFGAFCF